MSQRIQTFVLKDIGRTSRFLRRFAGSHTACLAPDGYGYHNAMTYLDVIAGDFPPDFNVAHEDPRWPDQCQCGYKFDNYDDRQVHTRHMYESSDTGEVVSEHVARPGAIWLAPRLAGVMDSKFHIDRGGGPHILIKLPGNHVWDASGKSTNGEGWEVSGDLTCLTASPSILVGGRVPYHGWLRNGVLVEC